MSRAAARAAVHFTLDVQAVFCCLGYSGEPILEEDRQLSINLAPILTASRPLFGNVHHRQIKHLQQAVIRRKYRLGFCHLAELTVESLDGVRGVNQTSDLLRKFETGAQISPVIPPGLQNLGIFFVPVFRKNVQRIQCRYNNTPSAQKRKAIYFSY